MKNELNDLENEVNKKKIKSYNTTTECTTYGLWHEAAASCPLESDYVGSR